MATTWDDPTKVWDDVSMVWDDVGDEPTSDPGPGPTGVLPQGRIDVTIEGVSS